MQVRATISPSEIQEAARMSRSRYFWVRFFVANWYSTLICVLVIGIAINALINHQHPKWDAMAGVFAFGAFFIGLSWYRLNTSLAKTATALSARSGTLSLEPDGIRATQVSGASTFVPWSSYDKWEEGKSVFLLKGSDGTAILPIDGGTRENVRTILANKIS